MFMSSADYRESLRQLNPRVFINGTQIENVADEPLLAPGVNAIGATYDFALDPEKRVLMLPAEEMSGKAVNRLLHINRTPQDLMYKLEAVRLICQEVGCAQRYLTQDALNAIWQMTFAMQAEMGGESHDRFKAYLQDVQDRDLTLGVAMTDGKGDRSLHPPRPTEPRCICTRCRTPCGWNCAPGNQGHRYRRALYARIPGDALPHHAGSRQGLCRLLRCAVGC